MLFATLSSRLPLSGAEVQKNKWKILTVFLDLELLRLRRIYIECYRIKQNMGGCERDSLVVELQLAKVVSISNYC